MFNALLNIIIKEVKELVRDPKILLGMIIVPLIMFPLMGFAIQTSMETAEQSIGKTSILLLDQDQGPIAKSLEDYLVLFNFTVTRLDDMSLDQAIAQVQDSNATNLVIIPSGFSQNITNVSASTLTVFTPFRGGGGIAVSSQSSAINSLLSSFETILINQRINQGFPEANSTEILNPILLSEKSIVNGKSADISPDVLFGLMIAQSTVMPVGMITLLIFPEEISFLLRKRKKRLKHF